MMHSLPLTTRKRHPRRAIALLAAVLLVSCATPMTEPALTVTLATATPGGGFPVYGDALIAAVRVTDPTLTLAARNTKGSTENIPLLEQGAVDLGLVQGDAAYPALKGIGRPPANVRILWAMYSTPGFFAVRADSPYRTIADLKGKPVAFGAKGSGLVIQAGNVLAALGLDRDRDFQAVYLERAGDGPEMLRDGRVASLWGGGIAWPGFTAVADAPGGARFIAPSAQEIDRIVERFPFLRPATLPANTYRGQAQDLPSVGSWSFVFARTTLPDETAYRLARALHRAEGDLAKRLPQAAQSTAANTLGAVSDTALIHPGVLRYLREAGIAKP